MNAELKKLINEVAYNCGMADMDSVDWDADKSDDSKLVIEGNQNPGPGSRVSVFWDMFDEPDEGYVLTLPGWDCDDIWMSGIVHIPKPQGCEKCDCDPEWIVLTKLLTLDSVVSVVISE